MALISNSASVAASAVTENLMTGSQFEFAPEDCMVEFGLCGDANGADMLVDVYSGTDVLCEGMRLNVRAAMPIYPDDFLLQDVVAAGERIKLRARNTSAAGARTIYYTVRITPMG
jgi:hypothetical protein